MTANTIVESLVVDCDESLPAAAGDSTSVEALMARPADSDGPLPAVLVVHDITGAEDDIVRTLRIVADHGYLALAPLLFTAGTNRAACIVSTMRSLVSGRGPVFAILESARRRLASDPLSTGEVAIVGFCMGGGFALLEGDARYVAAAPFYGSLTTYRAVMADTCPVVASFGARDPLIPFGESRLRRVLDKHKIPSDIKTYSGVGHSFANRIDSVPDAVLRVVGMHYDEDAASDAWARVFAFLDARFSA